MLCLEQTVIFFLKMIDSLLPPGISQTREKIRAAVARLKESRGSGRSPARTEPEPEAIGPLLSIPEATIESFKPGRKKSGELLWLLEELAAGFPEAALEAVVWRALIFPVLKKAGLDRTLPEPPGPGRGWAFPARSPLAYNHLFLPPPASRTLKLLESRTGPKRGLEDERGQYYLVFDLPAVKRILIPAASANNRSGTGVIYYLVEDERLSLEPCPTGKWHFPFRPAVCRGFRMDIFAPKIEPLLTLTAEQFRAGLEAYFLLLAAVFSGWARAGWQGLVCRQQTGNLPPELDTEISFLATEISHLQYGLFHLSRNRSIPGDCYTRKVERLCLKGLHLASRAWRHSSPFQEMNFFSGEKL